MALSIVQHDGFIPGGNVTSVNFSLSSTPISGNLLVVGIGVDTYGGDKTVTPPSGWTRLEVLRQDTVKLYVYYKEVNGETSSISFTISSGGLHSGSIYEIRDHNGIDGSYIHLSSNGATFDSPGVAPSIDGCQAVAFCAYDEGSVNGKTLNSVSSGWSIDETNIPTYHSSHAVSKDNLTSGLSSVSVTFTISSSVAYPISSIVIIAPKTVTVGIFIPKLFKHYLRR